MGKLKDILKNNDIVLAIGLVTIVLTMVIPIPARLLDLLLTLNISLSVLILLVCLYTKEPLEYSSFPKILLVATLFRLGLNVTSTRLILLEANAGSVIESFGQFVAGGNYVLGAVIFIILGIINFMVITRGDGLVSQIPALVISAATGLVISRASGSDNTLADDIKTEMFGNPKVLGIISGLLFFMGIVPGMPTLPFAAVSVAAGGFGYKKFKDKKEAENKAKIQAKEAKNAEKLGKNAKSNQRKCT